MKNSDLIKVNDLLRHLDDVEVGKWFRLRNGDRDLIRSLIKATNADILTAIKPREDKQWKEK